MKVAFAGLGAMGKGIAAKLADHLAAGKAQGFEGPLLCWNRTTETTKQFASKTSGVQAVESLSELAHADVVISILANDAAADAVLDGYLAARSSDGSAAKQPVYVSCATVLPETVKRQAAAASKAGVTFVNMPVFGRPDAAAAGQLIAVPAGAVAGREAIKPLLPAFAGRGTWDLGDDPSSSAALKLIGNFWIISQVEVASHCLSLANKCGIEDGAVLRMLETFLSSPIPLGYAKRISAGDYSTETGFAIDLALKDVGHMRQLAADTNSPLPLADLAFNHLLAARAKHGGKLDWGAVHLAVRDAAGLPPNFDNQHK